MKNTLLLSFISTLAVMPYAMAEGISIDNPWIAEAPPVSKVHAGYFDISNQSDNTMELKSVRSPAYRSIELHRSIEKDGRSSMLHLETLSLSPQQQVRFEPGSYHLMMFGPASRMTAGDVIELVFSFSDGQEIRKQATVKKHQAESHHHHHH